MKFQLYVYYYYYYYPSHDLVTSERSTRPMIDTLQSLLLQYVQPYTEAGTIPLGSYRTTVLAQHSGRGSGHSGQVSRVRVPH